MPKRKDKGQDPAQATDSTQSTANTTEKKEVKEREVKEQPNRLQLEDISRVNTSNFLDQKDLASLASTAKQYKNWRNLPGTDAIVTIPSTVNTTEEILKILGQYQQPDSKEDNKSSPKNNITSLDLSKCKYVVTDELLKAISGLLPKLKTLNLEYAAITDTGLSHLSNLPLQTLDLYSCRAITGAGLAHLSRLTSLQTLDLSLCREITDAGLAHLRNLKSLQTLDLRSCRAITDAGLAHLSRLTSLQNLYLSACTEITDAGLAHLSGLLLQTLDLSLCREITDAGLAHLRNLKSLQTLDLRGTRASERGKQDQKTPVENSSSQAVEYSSSSYSSAEQEQDQKQTIRRIPGVTEPSPSSDRMDTQEGKKSIEATTRSDIILEEVDAKSAKEKRPSSEVKSPEGSRKGGGKNNGCCTIS